MDLEVKSTRINLEKEYEFGKKYQENTNQWRINDHKKT